MMAILCKSDAIVREISLLAAPGETRSYDSKPGATPEIWLSECLSRESVSAVFYDSSFFTDPARYRRMSPRTKFVAITPPDDQETARAAMTFGACAVIQKPFTSQDVRGVISLVSN